MLKRWLVCEKWPRIWMAMITIIQFVSFQHQNDVVVISIWFDMAKTKKSDEIFRIKKKRMWFVTKSWHCKCSHTKICSKLIRYGNLLDHLMCMALVRQNGTRLMDQFITLFFVVDFNGLSGISISQKGATLNRYAWCNQFKPFKEINFTTLHQLKSVAVRIEINSEK